MMDTMPLLPDFTGLLHATPTTDAPAIASVEDQVKNFLQSSPLPQFKPVETFLANLQNLKEQMEGSEWKSSPLPQFNETFLANLQNLKEQMEGSEWKGFESWMR